MSTSDLQRPGSYFTCVGTNAPVSSHHKINAVISYLELCFAFKVIYKVLDPAIHVKDPYSLDIQGQYWRL